MNVEIGTEAALLPEKEYIIWIFVAVGVGDTRLEYIIAWPCVCIELTGAIRVHCKKY
jgi:hypothetical protein